MIAEVLRKSRRQRSNSSLSTEGSLHTGTLEKWLKDDSKLKGS